MILAVTVVLVPDVLTVLAVLIRLEFALLTVTITSLVLRSAGITIIAVLAFISSKAVRVPTRIISISGGFSFSEFEMDEFAIFIITGIH